MTARSVFRQADLVRAVKGATAAGMRVGRIEIEPASGKIVIVSETAVAAGDGPNPWDKVLKR